MTSSGGSTIGAVSHPAASCHLTTRHGRSRERRPMTSVSFRDDFDGADLDRSVWFPHYLPAWSSRHETRAAWRVADSALTLSIPAEHPRWCPDEHVEPLRVSGIQSGNRSGPVGSNDAQQRFRDDLIVREAQP